MVWNHAFTRCVKQKTEFCILHYRLVILTVDEQNPIYLQMFEYKTPSNICWFDIVYLMAQTEGHSLCKVFG